VRRFPSAILLVALLAGCGPQPASNPPAVLRLATTTSTENSGLLDVLLPEFRRRTGIEVHVMPMGTGKALRTARDGNCDVVMVHAPEAEAQFVRDGWGVDRRQFMYNDFVVLGPAADPAAARGAASVVDALKAIAAAGRPFVSRGDNSGTQKKETSLWRQGSLNPDGDWYRSVGKGMGEALTMANEMQAYVLADRGTYLKFRRKIELVVLVEGDAALHNPYGVIAVNPARHGHVNHEAARKLIEFLTSEDGQRLIGDYKLEGERLFHPWPEDSSQPQSRRQDQGP
jgi:tungstate transport system substrate-binding protein